MPEQEGHQPIPEAPTDAEINQFNTISRKITAYMEYQMSQGQTPHLPSGLDPVVVRHLVEMWAPTGAPAVAFADVVRDLTEKEEHRFQLINDSKEIFDRIARGVEAIVLSHGTSLEAVQGINTDEIDTSRGPAPRKIAGFSLPGQKAREREAENYRLLRWEIAPFHTDGRELPQLQRIHYIRDASAKEFDITEYEFQLIDQVTSEGGKKAKEEIQDGPIFALEFDPATHEINGIKISWKQITRNLALSSPDLFLSIIKAKSPALSNLIDRTMIKPELLAGVTDVDYTLQIDLGNSALGRSPSINFVTKYLQISGSPQTEITRHNVENKNQYTYTSDSGKEGSFQLRGKGPEESISEAEYINILRGVRDMMPVDKIRQAS